MKKFLLLSFLALGSATTFQACKTTTSVETSSPKKITCAYCGGSNSSDQKSCRLCNAPIEK